MPAHLFFTPLAFFFLIFSFFFPILFSLTYIQIFFPFPLKLLYIIRMQHNGNGAGPAGAATTSAAVTHPACASCKHQRKRCDDRCILAPLFPAQRSREFQAVHRMYGVSNVQKLVKSLQREEDRRHAANSLVWEASCREKDPVWGALGEYRKVCEELTRWRNHATITESQNRAHSPLPLPPPMGWNGAYRPSTIGTGMGVRTGTRTNNGYGIHHQHQIGDAMDGSVYDLSSSHMRHVHENLVRKQEREVFASSQAVQIAGQQQHPFNGFHDQQHYSHTGQFSPNEVDSKSLGSAIWEGGS